MKKSLLLFSAILIMTVGCFAQTEVQNFNKKDSFSAQRGQNEYRYVPNQAVYNEYEGNALVDFRDSYTYDEYEWYLVDKHTEKNINGTWVSHEQTSYSYNFAGSIENILHRESINGVMTNDVQETYTYDNMGSVVQEILFEDWQNGNWVSSEKHIFTYDPSTTIIIKEFIGNQWENKNMYTFITSGNTETILYQDWEMGAWVNNTQCIKTYDNSNNLVTILEQEWINGAWVNDEMYTYTYAEIGVCSSILVEDWMNGTWVNEYQFSYQNQNGNAVSAVCVKWENNAWVEANGDIVMPYNYFENALNYDDCHQVDMTYFDLYQLGCVEHKESAHFSVFPNPVSDYFYVEGENLQSIMVSDINGQMVMQERLSSDKEMISTKTLCSGTYFVTVIANNGVEETHRIIVK
jgi:hypothetical protein